MSTTLPTPRRTDQPVEGTPRTPRPSQHPAYTILLATLVVIAAGYGLLLENAYRSVPDLLEQTWRAQDAVTLLTVPLLLATARRARNGSLPAHLVSVGVLTWLTYAYAHLAVGAPFTPVFLVYVAIVALAGFAMLDGLLRVDVTAVAPAFSGAPVRAAVWFLTVAGLGTAGLWLSDILVGITGGSPANLHLAELPNPTWLLDLAWIIPASLGAAVMLHRRHSAGPVVAAVMLVMLFVLSVAMLAVVPFALTARLAADPAVVVQLVAFSVVFTILGAIEARLLLTGQRRLGAIPAGWWRSGWWAER